ncbi:TIGR00730 family Rossman fold protein [Bacteroidales bacterium OttesenSCG-928-C19]|nr:TIGR00730 family Rossman fold protein [Bacteroidales bacterium OttesenSCG-928-C19]
MKQYQNICVFCGSKSGTNPVYKEAANELGRLIGKYGKTLYYGSGCTGLMREVAKSASEYNVRIVGVIPRFFPLEVVEQEPFVEKIHIETMDQRKVIMAKESDVFVALPGGYGTLDELFEVLALNQLKLSNTKVFLLNTNQFYSSLIQQLEKMVEEGFMSKEHLQILQIVDTPEEIFETNKPLNPLKGTLL